MTAPDYFYPNQQAISAISQSLPVIITTYNPHNYKNGLVVRVFVPSNKEYFPFKANVNYLGIPQINGLLGEVTVLSPTTFSLPIDSSSFDTYTPGIGFPEDNEFVGQVIPVGEIALTLTSATVNNRNIVPEIFGTPPSPNYPLNPVIFP